MTQHTHLGSLKRIPDISGIWPDEARDFTPWLALPENLALLAEALGIGPDAKGFLTFLEQSRADIEEACGFSLTWDYMEGRDGGRATVERRGVRISDEAQWPDQHRWLFSKLDSMRRAFHSPVRALDPDSLALI